MTEFKPFQIAVAKQFKRMEKHPMFRVGTDRTELWEQYMNAFPEGTNEMYRKRREYDCSCCRQFIRAVGNVVAVINGRVESIWDAKLDDPTFAAVASKMAQYVKSKPIVDAFLHYEARAGTEKNFEDAVNGIVTWNHFFVNIPQQFVLKGKDIPTRLNELRGDHDVLLRGLKELTDESIDTALELAAQNTMYRAAESKADLEEFKKLKRSFNELKTDAERDVFVWTVKTRGSVARLFGTAMGTFLQDVSADVDLEQAVKSFETKMDPHNYRRPSTAPLVSAASIKKAKETVEQLGLTSALQRRYANLRDVTIENVLFVDRSTRQAMSGDVFDVLADAAPKKQRQLDGVEEIGIEKFLKDVLPRAESIEVLVEGRHINNLVSLVAPVDPTAGQMFKWPNPISWSYNGEVADSIKERVKRAGGNVTGDVCCRLAWSNYDDLDFHLQGPSFKVWFRDKRPYNGGGWNLDVDMNAGGGTTREPVENIVCPDIRKAPNGTYQLVVHQFSKRESNNVGFEVEIDGLGTVHRFAYDAAVKQGETIHVADIEVKNGVVTINGKLPSRQAGKQVWGIQTEAFSRVNLVLLSPNCWDGRDMGNKHYMFMLDGCKNDEGARGFYNEFLKDDLRPHRKVLELVGSKMKTERTDDQLSGLGFSSTQQNSLLCRIKGSFTRTVKIVF